jgi:hypothetical protein
MTMLSIEETCILFVHAHDVVCISAYVMCQMCWWVKYLTGNYLLVGGGGLMSLNLPGWVGTNHKQPQT